MLLLTILLTSVVDVSVRFFTSGEFLIFSKPLKTLVKKFDHPIPIIARIIIAIKTIMISVLTNYHHIYSKTAIKTKCVLFYLKVEYAYFYYSQMLLWTLWSKLSINLIINEIDRFCLVNFFYRTC